MKCLNLSYVCICINEPFQSMNFMAHSIFCLIYLVTYPFHHSVRLFFYSNTQNMYAYQDDYIYTQSLCLRQTTDVFFVYLQCLIINWVIKFLFFLSFTLNKHSWFSKNPNLNICGGKPNNSGTREYLHTITQKKPPLNNNREKKTT